MAANSDWRPLGLDRGQGGEQQGTPSDLVGLDLSRRGDLGVLVGLRPTEPLERWEGVVLAGLLRHRRVPGRQLVIGLGEQDRVGRREQQSRELLFVRRMEQDLCDVGSLGDPTMEARAQRRTVPGSLPASRNRRWSSATTSAMESHRTGPHATVEPAGAY